MSQVIVDNQTFSKALDSLLQEGKVVSFTVKGNSMLPFFKHEKTIVNLTKKSEYQRYDVILFKYHQLIKLHRIIAIKDDDVMASGDYISQIENIKKDDILGYVQSFKNKHEIQSSSKGYLFKVKLWLVIKKLRFWRKR
jgi:signal peptidase I